MKRWLTVLLLLVCAFSEAQVVARLFYNKDWALTKRDSAVYFRVAILDTTQQIFVGDVKDFTKDAKLLMTGTYATGKRNGTFVSYYRNGKKESEGAYQENQRVGVWQYYHPNGELKHEVGFDGDIAYIKEARDSTGKVVLKDGTGVWEETYTEPAGTKVLVSGTFKEYQPEGTWTFRFADGTIWAEEIFKQGALVSGYVVADGMKIEINQSVATILPEDYKHSTIEYFAVTELVTPRDYPYIRKLRTRDGSEDLVFTIVEISARPMGGMAAFYKTISSLMRYPKEARRKGIEGRVFVEFVIERDGRFSNTKVIKGIGAGCDEEALRVLEESQKFVRWYPGVQRRIRVKQRYTLPVIFKL